MVDFAEKRLQVFVSSTYSDLIAERQAAVEAILVAGHIPAGMELFAAGDESQMDVIRQWIDASDAFVLILGGRYGAIEPRSGKSYTHIEYEYAVERRKPLFSCVISESALAARANIAGAPTADAVHAEKLRVFRELVLSRLVRFWDDTKDIKVVITQTLASIARRDGLSGWVRATDQRNLGALREQASLKDLGWLRDPTAMLELEATSSEVWIISSHLLNDTGNAFSVELGSPSTIAAVQANLRRLAHYKFLVPDTEHIRARLPQLLRNYGDDKIRLDVVLRPAEAVRCLTTTEIAIYNPTLEGAEPPRAFVELPVRALHHYWAELAEDAAYALLARVRSLMEGDIAAVSSPHT